MAHISFLTYGTRGDVEPLLALALHFKGLGYEICFAAPADFQDWIEGEGLEFRPTTLTPIRQIVENPALQNLMHFNVLKIPQALRTLKGFIRETLVDTLPNAVGPTDLIVAHCGLPVATDVAEKWNVPVVFLSPIPAMATRAFPVVPFTRSLGFFNKYTYLPVKHARLMMPSVYRDARKALGLAPKSRFQPSFEVNGIPSAVLHIYSKHLIPRPSDWPEYAQITGQLFLDQYAKDWQPDPALAKFLDQGPAPVYVGFGSMITGQAENLVEIVLRTAERSGQRVLLSSGWAGFNASDLPDTVFLLDDVPHHALFPKLKAVIHHGGAGTLAAGLRAGRPTLVCPFGFDQPWWGDIVARRGLGPRPVPQSQLTLETFYKAFEDVAGNETYKHAAAEMGDLIRQEDGVKKTAQTIINLFGLT